MVCAVGGVQGSKRALCLGWRGNGDKRFLAYGGLWERNWVDFEKVKRA